MAEFKNISNKEFIELLASKAPVPGGGGASALVAAVGTALGNMVGSLTVGKKKYAEVEDEIKALMQECDKLQEDFLRLMDEDAKSFEPLAKAYSLPKDTPEEQAYKEEVLERESVNACSVPLEIMEKCCRAIEIVEVMAAKGSVLAVSDAGAAATLLSAALKAVSLNVFINTKGLKDRAKAVELNGRAEEMLATYVKRADKVFEEVMGKLK